MDESAGATVAAADGLRTTLRRSGRKARPIVSIEADEDRRHQRAADRADAADDDDHEGEDEDVLAHADLGGENGGLHQAGETGERRPDAEHERIEQLDVDPQRGGHLAVGGAGADQHADARAHDHQIEREGDEQRHDDDRQAVHRIVDAGQELDGGVEPGRQREIHARRAPDQAHQLVEEQNEPEGTEHVVEMVAAVEPPHGDHLDRHPDQERRHQRESDAAEERVGEAGEGRGEVGAQHVERAVRQVDEVHDAEHQRQSGSEQEQQEPELQPVQELLEEEQHGFVDRHPLLHPSSRKLEPRLPSRGEAIRDLPRANSSLPRSRLGALLADGSHRSGRDDG